MNAFHTLLLNGDPNSKFKTVADVDALADRIGASKSQRKEMEREWNDFNNLKGIYSVNLNDLVERGLDKKAAKKTKQNAALYSAYKEGIRLAVADQVRQYMRENQGRLPDDVVITGYAQKAATARQLPVTYSSGFWSFGGLVERPVEMSDAQLRAMGLTPVGRVGTSNVMQFRDRYGNSHFYTGDQLMEKWNDPRSWVDKPIFGNGGN